MRAKTELALRVGPHHEYVPLLPNHAGMSIATAHLLNMNVEAERLQWLQRALQRSLITLNAELTELVLAPGEYLCKVYKLGCRLNFALRFAQNLGFFKQVN